MISQPITAAFLGTTVGMTGGILSHMCTRPVHFHYYDQEEYEQLINQSAARWGARLSITLSIVSGVAGVLCPNENLVAMLGICAGVIGLTTLSISYAFGSAPNLEESLLNVGEDV